MNQEKLNIFVRLIDEAIRVAEERREIMQTPEFYNKCKDAGWITQKDIDLGKNHLEEKYEYIFHYKFLDENIICGLKYLKYRYENGDFDDRTIKYQKGHRGGFGMIRGISDCGDEMWGDVLYDYSIFNACVAIEKYFNHELE